MTTDAARSLLKFATGFLEPIAQLKKSPASVGALIDLTGWNLAGSGINSTDIVGLGASLSGAVDKLKALDPQHPVSVENVMTILPDVVSGLTQLATLLGSVQPTNGLPQDLGKQFAEDLLGCLLLITVSNGHPAVRTGLELLGLLAYRQRDAIVNSTGVVVRPARHYPKFDLEVVSRFFANPGDALLRQFGFVDPADPPASQVAARVFPLWAAFLNDLGLATWALDLGTPPGSVSAEELAAERRSMVVRLPVDGALPGAATSAILVVSLADIGSGKYELIIVPRGALSISRELGDWQADFGASTSPGGLAISSNAVRFSSATTAVKLDGSIGRRAGAPPMVRFGNPAGMHGEILELRLAGTLDIAAAPPRVSGGARIDIKGLQVSVRPDPKDGFLASTLPGDGLGARCDLALAWTGGGGIVFEGSGDLLFEHSVQKALGPVTLRNIKLAIKAQSAGLSVSAAVGADVKLGPVQASIDQIGLAAGITTPNTAAGRTAVTVGFKPPTGIALKIEAGPVKGGGFLLLDVEAGQYAGAVQLSVKAIGLTAVGIVTTKFPDGRDGFSMIVVIAADFPSIPLPFGFALNGVGGLVGIHRRMDTEALKVKVSEGALGSILFPRDPVGRIQAVLSDLSAIFPVEEGRYVFGPMVRLTWGPAGILSIEVAVILDVPSPLRLAILGRMRLVLPSPESAVADIRLDVVGILDFERQNAVIAASLIDSRLFGFTLTGDMGMLLSWGATKSFAMSLGGFYPGFPVPEGLPPRFNRLTLALGSGSNPRLRLESYLAITSNTIQFGGALDLHAAAGTFAVTGRLSLDAFLQFDPFRFEMQIMAMLAITLGGTPLLSARLEASLSGPKPWHAKGFAEFQIIVPLRIPFEVTVGEAEPPAPTQIDLLQLLTVELARKESWAAIPDPAAGGIASLREAGGNEIVLHPLSQLALVQRALPFGKVVSRYGAALPDNGPVRFAVSRFSLTGATEDTFEPVLADFAPGQYEALSDAEKLSRPDFEPMTAGARLPMPGVSVSAASASWSPGYDEFVLFGPVESQPSLSSTAPVATGEADQGLELTAGDGGVRLRPERFVVADAETLETAWPVVATSRSEAEDRLAALGEAARTRQVVVNVSNSWTMP
jgi:hypothetical protein